MDSAEKLAEIRVKVNAGRSFSDLSNENREFVFLRIQEAVGELWKEQLPNSDDGKEHDRQSE